MNEEERKPRLKPIIEGAESLSLGISIVVAVLIGVAFGFGLKHVFNVEWVFWIGVFIGIAAAVLNVYKAYSKQYKEFEKLAQEPRYKYKKQLEEEEYKEDDDEDYGEKNY
ncbi:AtpZ/AtpI family protein [Sulfurimonas sp. HSL-1716]|uniref:AtpZ/AtpI family protein n=1 Tax=Hydrocurvibacter sulfurireducens TaxID=3131937 RepID=UPI0031F80356